ncbi:MAG: ISL3 family transposase [Candidatus Peregrinibacteria bacterium]
MRRIRDLSCGGRRVYMETTIRRVDCPSCSSVIRESLAWLATNPHYTKRFVRAVGRRCKDATVKSVAEEFSLDWHTVKEIDKEYMRDQLKKAGNPAPRKMGVDELSVEKGHRYRVIVSDLERRRAIWFGGKGKSKADLDLFFLENGEKRNEKIELVAMDMSQAFQNSAKEHVPDAVLLFDKFHVTQKICDALDEIRKSEYERLTGHERAFIKGQKYVLLRNRENLDHNGQKSLKLLLNANKRLQTSYLLKESFDQFWTYTSEAWARKFFDRWKESLKWQRLKPLEEFAAMVERHWKGIIAHLGLKDIPLGFVEGLNNKIRVIQRRSYGLRDEEYLRLKVLTSMLPKL